MSTEAPRTRPAFADLRADFDRVVGSVVYATMTTVDAKGRPRSRVLIPVWETAGAEPIGWLGTFRTPVKAAHLAGNPHATFSYWSPAQHTAAADVVATWDDDPDTREHVWELYRKGSPPVAHHRPWEAVLRTGTGYHPQRRPPAQRNPPGAGYDPIAYWPGGPADPGFHVLRLEPWRIQVLRAHELAAGRPPRIWRSDRPD